MSNRGTVVPDHFVHNGNGARDTHILVPLRIIVWVCSVLLTVFAGLVGTGIWLDQRDTTTRTAAANKVGVKANSISIQKLTQRMAINEQTDKTQDAELDRLTAQVENISAQQGVNSQHLAAIESLLQQLNDRLKEISSRMDNGSFGRNRRPKSIPHDRNVADNRRVRLWNQ